MDRMLAIIAPAVDEPTEEQRTFEAIAARASQPVDAILNEPETQRRLAAINSGGKPT